MHISAWLLLFNKYREHSEHFIKKKKRRYNSIKHISLVLPQCAENSIKIGTERERKVKVLFLKQ